MIKIEDCIEAIHAEALTEARRAAERFFTERLGGRDQFACGRAWVDLPDVRGNTRLGKKLLSMGFKKPYGRKGLYFSDPSRMPVQNVDTLFHGAVAYARVLESWGIHAVADSNLD